MILTIKRPHNLDLTKEPFLVQFLKEANIVKRCAFNFFKKKGKNIPDCEKHIKQLNNINVVNASWIKSIANSVKNIDDDVESFFGSKHYFKLLAENIFSSDDEKHKIKDKFRLSRDTQMVSMRGSRSDSNTNRCGKLVMLNNILYIEFKIDKDHVYHFEFDNIKGNDLDDLNRLYDLIQQKKAYFNIGINQKNIYIQYRNDDLIEKQTDLIVGRILSIDMNPHEIGLVVMENGKIIEEIVYDINKLIKNGSANKTDHECHQINKAIVECAMHYKCSVVAVEKLKLKNSKIKLFNQWNIRDLTIGINKWCDYYGINFCEINAYYSSFMGSYFNQNKIDSIASAIEIGYRCLIKDKSLIEERIKNFLSTETDINSLSNRWKKEIVNKKQFKDKLSVMFLDIYKCLKKNSKAYYRVRVRFNDVIDDIVGYSFKSKKSLIGIYFVKNKFFD